METLQIRCFRPTLFMLITALSSACSAPDHSAPLEFGAVDPAYSGTSANYAGNPGQNDGTLAGTASAGAAASAAGGAGSEASSGTGNSTGDAGTTTAPGKAARCQLGRVWQGAGSLNIPQMDQVARFSGISGDELTIAWTNATGDAFVAERASVTEPFAAAVQVNGSTTLAVDRVALSPNGRTIVAFRADRGSFLSFSRKGQTWSATAGDEFADLATVFEGGAVGSEPVLSADKSSLYFLITRPRGAVTLYESKWQGASHAWNVPTNAQQPELVSTDTAHRRRPTGTSADGLTLFFFDEGLQQERAGWRATTSALFSVFEDLGMFSDAIPDSSCSSLYYQDNASKTELSLAEW